MANEEQVSPVSRVFEEGKAELAVGHDSFAAEDCTAKCPTCQPPCEYTAGHAGLHQGPNRHEWV